jgi:3-hydroxyisobutyrate dehydrogenase
MIGRYALRHFSSAPNKKVGFIGLGNMGFSMMKNCMKKGYMVTAFDTNSATLEKAEELGAKAAPDVKAATVEQDICLTMLPNTDIVEETRKGKGGIFENAKEGCLVIDSSTISPISSKTMAEEGEKLGLRVADAPVSGGVTGAANGTLTFMVGSKKDYFEEIKEFLSSMGANVYHCGAPGTGQTSKI